MATARILMTSQVESTEQYSPSVRTPKQHGYYHKVRHPHCVYN